MFENQFDWLKPKPRTSTRRAPAKERLARALRMERLEDRRVLASFLGTAGDFAVLGGSTVTNTGPTTLNGDLGVYPGNSITGLSDISYSGTLHINDAVALQAQNDLTTAYITLAGQTPTQPTFTNPELGGLTLTPGVYKFDSSAQLTGMLTLDAQGNPDAQFIFQIGSALTTASNSSVRFINGASCEVYWQIGSSATLGTGTAFAGNIVALTSITLNTTASITYGSALARNGAVTMDTNTIAVGVCGTGSISGQKFDDTNGNGIFDVGEPGLAGRTLFIDLNGNDEWDANEVGTTTDEFGNYSFSGLVAGTYSIRQATGDGFVQTTDNPDDIELESGENRTDVDFGDFKLISISGTKFLDADANGEFDVLESGMIGWTIFLDADGDGELGDTELFTITDAYGNYSFENLPPGTYTVREVQQFNFTQTTDDPDAFEAVSGVNITDVLFGNSGSFVPISISGTKFEDINGNGVFDDGEPLLDDWSIFLDTNGNGELDDDEVSVETLDGIFTFENLPAGIYTVREVQKPGFTQTTGDPVQIVASSGVNVSGVLFGNFELATITGRKFQDTNGNGVGDTGEMGLEGWEIYLDINGNRMYDAGEPIAETDANGDYIFLDVPLGTYSVREVHQLDFVQMTDNPPAITVSSSGATLIGGDFGNIPVLSLVTFSKRLFMRDNYANLFNGVFAAQAQFIAEELYQELLGVAPDLAGIKYYLVLFQSGYTEAQVTAAFRNDFNLGPAPEGEGFGLGVASTPQGEALPTDDADLPWIAITSLEPFALHNTSLVHDVNDDGDVTPLDALLVLNSITRQPGNGMPMSGASAGVGEAVTFPLQITAADVNGDGLVTPIDALLVLNHLHRQQLGHGSLKASGEGPADLAAVSRVLAPAFVVNSAVATREGRQQAEERQASLGEAVAALARSFDAAGEEQSWQDVVSLVAAGRPPRNAQGDSDREAMFVNTNVDAALDSFDVWSPVA